MAKRKRRPPKNPVTESQVWRVELLGLSMYSWKAIARTVFKDESRWDDVRRILWAANIKVNHERNMLTDHSKEQVKRILKRKK